MIVHHPPRYAFTYPSATVLDVIRREQELQEGIANRALFVEYQPIFRLRTHDMLGAEALVRWNHPTRGVLMPADFIPVAEASGLIVPIGEFVLEEACRQLRRWQTPETRRLSVSVNVSAVQLAHGDFVRVVRECVADYGVKPDRLQLEITETVPFEDRAVVVNRLGEIRRLGVHIVLDDFGCGYMSLSHLATLAVDGLKIDRSFTRALPDDPKAVAVVTFVMGLAAQLGLSVVVEGVETERQVRWLRRFSDVCVQGFLYGRPQAPVCAPVMMDAKSTVVRC